MKLINKTVNRKEGSELNLGIETETLEYKKSTGELKEAMCSISAILNKHQHGELYFGVKTDGTVIGQVVTEESLREVSQKIKNSIEPKIYPEVKKVVIDGRDCIYVKFEGNRTPYFAFGVARIRVADEDLIMSPQELAEYIRKGDREEYRWENLISNKTIDDVDEELLKKYTSQAHDVGRIAINYTDKKTVLNQLELSEGENLINAGKALFADDLIQDIQMAIFATEDRLTFNDIQRHHGPVLKLVEIAENYIKSNIHWRVEFTGTLQRTEIPEVPMDAIREALLNSFCHKDYSTGQSNEVAIYKDRIEIYNPGAFPEGFEPQDFIERPERPIRRNPKIARILYYSKDIESFGTGLKRIADACEIAGVRYEFKKLKSGFVVCFYRSEESTDKVRKSDEKSTEKRRKSDEKATEKRRKSDGKTTEKTKKQYARIISKMSDGEWHQASEIAEILGLKDTRTKQLLRKLVEADKLEDDGKTKGKAYRLRK